MSEAPAITVEAQSRLKSFIERVERLNEDKDSVNKDLKEVYAEARGEGFDTGAIKQVVKLRAMDRAKRQEAEAILDLYISAIGGL
jgi:uncharacterized protein (UPF0335 family)